MLVSIQLYLQDKSPTAPFQDYWPCLKILEVDIAMIIYLMCLFFVFLHLSPVFFFFFFDKWNQMVPIFWALNQLFLLLPPPLEDFSLYPSLLVPETLTQATCVAKKEIDKDKKV